MKVGTEVKLSKEFTTAIAIGAGLVFGGLCAYKGATWLGDKIVDGYNTIKEKIKE